MDTDLRNLWHGGRPNPGFPSDPCSFLLVSLCSLSPLLRPSLLLLRVTRAPCRRSPVRRRVHRGGHSYIRRMPLLRCGQHVLLLRGPPLGHGAAHGGRRQRLVVGEVRPGRGVRPRHPPQRRGHAAEEGGELGARRGAGPEKDDGVDAAHGGDRGGARVRDVPGGGRAAAAVLGQLLRRGDVGGVCAQGGEGVGPTDCGGGGGENEGAGGGGEGAEARWDGGGVGPGPRAGVRPETAGIENGGHQGVGAGHRLHGQQSHCLLPQAQPPPPPPQSRSRRGPPRLEMHQSLLIHHLLLLLLSIVISG